MFLGVVCVKVCSGDIQLGTQRRNIYLISRDILIVPVLCTLVGPAGVFLKLGALGDRDIDAAVSGIVSIAVGIGDIVWREVQGRSFLQDEVLVNIFLHVGGTVACAAYGFDSSQALDRKLAAADLLVLRTEIGLTDQSL